MIVKFAKYGNTWYAAYPNNAPMRWQDLYITNIIRKRLKNNYSITSFLELAEAAENERDSDIYTIAVKFDDPADEVEFILHNSNREINVSYIT